MITLRVGLISDTHGLLRPEATAFLRGCSRIIHGGDVGSPRILEQLSSIAPTTAVRGNIDTQSWAQALPETQLIQAGDIFIYVLHDLAQLQLEPGAARPNVIVSGHSHRPAIEERDGVLYVNPGSAGPRRFRLPVTVADLEVIGRSVTPRIVALLAESEAAATHSPRSFRL